MEDTYFMDEALALAREAAADGEVPVGCVIVRGDTIVGRGRNRRETDKSALAHAEIEAIGEACRRLGGWRLWECTLYVTLEPCPMCAGAISTPASPGWSTALPTGSAALWIRCAVCFPWSSIITRKWKAASGKPSAGRC